MLKKGISGIESPKESRAPLAYEETYKVARSLVKHFGIDKIVHLSVDQVGTFHSPIGEKDVRIDLEIEMQRILGVDLAKVACPTNPEKAIGNWFVLECSCGCDEV